MAKFRNGDLYLKDNQYTRFGTSQDANIWWDGSSLRLDSTVSGVDPTQAYHLTTKSYVDTEVSTVTGSITTDHGNLVGLSDDDHNQYILVDGTRDFSGVFGAVGITLTDGDIQYQSSPSSDHDVSGSTSSGSVSNVTSFGQVLYMKSDGTLDLAKADSNATMPASALTTTDSNGLQKILLHGYARDDSWDWSPGELLYVSEGTAGGLSHTAPTASGAQVQVVGIATHADRILFNPNYILSELGDDPYYTKEELTTSGVLDVRYYTETELDNGALDSRYYTETEIDNNFYTQTEVDNNFLPLSGGTLTGSLVIQQDLIVSGTEFITETETVKVEDNLLVINYGEPGAGVTEGEAGIEVDRGSETNYQFLFNETYDNFRVGISGALQPVATRMESGDMTASGVVYWDESNYRLITTPGFTYDAGNVSVTADLPTSDSHLTRKDYVDSIAASVSGATTFTGLTDTPGSYTNKSLLVSSASDIQYTSPQVTIDSNVLTLAQGGAISTDFKSSYTPSHVIDNTYVVDSDWAEAALVHNTVTINGPGGWIYGMWNEYDIPDNNWAGYADIYSDIDGGTIGTNAATYIVYRTVTPTSISGGSSIYGVYESFDFSGLPAGQSLDVYAYYHEGGDIDSSGTITDYGYVMSPNVGNNQTVYGFEIWNDGGFSTGGNLYGFYSNFNNSNTTYYPIYINDPGDHSIYSAGGDNYFAGQIRTDSDVKFQSEPSSDHSVSGNTSSGTVSNVTDFGQPLYMKSDGTWDLANATDDSAMPCAALSTASGSGNNDILTYGYARDDSWNWTPGSEIYIDTSAGQLTQTAPTASGAQVQVVGIATHADRIFFNPDYTMVEIGDSGYYTTDDIIHGRQSIGNGVDHIDVSFSDVGSTNYTVNATLENTSDSPPSIYAFIVSSKSSSGFTVSFMGDTDSANYVLNWSIILDQ